MITSGIFLLLALVVYCGTHASGVPLAEFYPFGSGVGDSRLVPNDDGSSPRVVLPSPFLFFDRDHNALFVSDSVHPLAFI